MIPRISVIIATRNRLKHLKICIESLLSQKTRYPYEIIIIDDGSNDGTAEAIKKMPDKKIRLIQNKKKGPASARNSGAKAARGTILAFLDDDCIADSNWIDTIGTSFSKYKGASLIAGHTVFIYQSGILKNITEYELKQRKKISSYVTRLDKPVPWCPLSTENCAFKKNTFMSLNGFDEKYKTASGEDTDLCLRALRKGHVFYKINAMQVRHIQRDDIKGLVRRYYSFGITDALNQKKHFPKYRKNIVARLCNQTLNRNFLECQIRLFRCNIHF